MLTSQQPVWVGWGDDLVYFYNDAYKSIIGGKHPWALGQPTSVVWREIWSDIAPMLAKALSGYEGTYVEAQLLVMERNGYPEETYYTFSYSPIFDENGVAMGIFCANTDETKRVVGERQLALLRELAASAANARTWRQACERSAGALATNARDLPFTMTYVLDPGGQSASLAGATGIDPGHPAAPARISLDDASSWPLAEALRRDALSSVEIPVAASGDLPRGPWDRPPNRAAMISIPSIGETGRSGVFIAGLSPLRLLDDDYSGFLHLVATQIAAAIAHAEGYEAERRRAEALTEIDRAKTTFFSNTSHEFRTPLTLMLSPLQEILARDPETTRIVAERRELELIQRNGMRLQKLVNALLDFSSIEAGRLQAVYEPIDLAAYTAELASTFQSAMDKAGLKFVVDCPPLPSRVHVDVDMWEKIVLNLVSNAFKFTLAGEIEVALRAGAEGRDVTLTVRDSGVGIPSDELPHIFERFHRVRGQRGRTQEGTGIGLAMVQELARLHGGTARAVSALGQGATLAVTIPTGAAHLPQESVRAGRELHAAREGAEAFLEEALRWLPGGDGASAESVDDTLYRSRAEATPSGEGRRVLLADDNADMRDYVRRLLSPHYIVEAVGDGEAALAAAKRRRPDLVLTDVMMPRLDGFGLLRAIRSDAGLREVPVILLSARAGEEASVEGLESGADDYLVKPFNAREMLARVRANLELSALRREALQIENELRRQAELAQERAESILASISDGFVTIDKDWRLNFVNAAAERLLDNRREDLVGERFWDLYPETVTSVSGVNYRRAMSERVSVAFENFSARMNRWFDVRVYPARDGGISLYFQDVTERKHAEKALADSEARYRMLFNAMTEAYVVHDIIYDAKGEAVDFFAIEANPAFETHTGIARDLVVGHLASEFAPGGDPQWLRFFAEVVRTGKADRRERYSQRPRRWVDLRAFPLGGPRLGIVFNDVTERRNAEIAREAAEARLAAAMAVAEVGAFDYDPATATLSSSGSCNAIFGFSDALTSRPLAEYLAHVDAEDAPNFQAEMEAALRLSRSVALEFRVRASGSVVKWVAMRGAAVDNMVGGPRFVGALFDITARKGEELRKEAEREHAEVMFREMNHRTKNNLTIIASMLRLQASANKNDPNTQRHLDAARERIMTIAELHTSLYQGEVLGQVDLGDYLRKLCAHIETGLISAEREISFVVETESIMLSADVVIRVGLVVNELVTNAVKHAFDDSTDGAVIYVSASARDGRLSLSVADNGRGLPEDWSSRGNSLGARIVDSFVRQAGGELEAVSARGTRFEIRIPV